MSDTFFDHEKEITKFNLILEFAKTVHKIKSSVYKNAWRKRGWDSIKANYYRKIDAIVVLPQVYIKKPPVDAKAAGFDGETS